MTSEKIPIPSANFSVFSDLLLAAIKGLVGFFGNSIPDPDSEDPIHRKDQMHKDSTS